MKKHLYFAFVAAGMLCACSSSDDVVDAGGNVPGVDENGRPEISIGVGSSQVTTRGLGSVGANHNDLTGHHQWDGQSVYVYMFNKPETGEDGTVSKQFDPAKDNGISIYENAEFMTPTGTDKGVARHKATGWKAGDNYKVSYYPLSGAFDFWGYYIDDKTVTPTITTETDTDPATITVPFTIDGSNDIMAASTKDPDALPEGITAKDLYSAKAARSDVQPNLYFEHKLTRFTFNAYAYPQFAKKDANDKDNPDAVRINAIRVYSRTTGKLVAKYDADNKIVTNVEFDEGEPTALSLKERVKKNVTDSGDENQTKEVDDYTTELKDLFDDPATGAADKGIDLPGTAADAVKIGEALLVQPNQDKYRIEVVVQQNLVTEEDAEGNPIEDTREYVTRTIGENADLFIANAKDGEGKDVTFDAGKSYDVTLKVYGLSRIEITVSLAPWEEGGKVEIDPGTTE